jgi:hypothetical protein
MGPDDEEAYGPEFEVWNHLYGGLDIAEMEFAALDEETRNTVEGFGKMIVQLRSSFSHPPELSEWVGFFDRLLDDAWFRFSAEIELGREGVKRFLELRPVFTNYRVGEKAGGYLRQVVDTFLFGFDAACIALCGAALEQVLRELVIAAGIYTEGRINREKPSGHTLLEAAKREGKITGVYDAAKRVLDQRNHVMHRSLWEERIIKGLALQSITDLGRVLAALEPRENPDLPVSG